MCGWRLDREDRQQLENDDPETDNRLPQNSRRRQLGDHSYRQRYDNQKGDNHMSENSVLVLFHIYDEFSKPNFQRAIVGIETVTLFFGTYLLVNHIWDKSSCQEVSQKEYQGLYRCLDRPFPGRRYSHKLYIYIYPF